MQLSAIILISLLLASLTSVKKSELFYYLGVLLFFFSAACALDFPGQPCSIRINSITEFYSQPPRTAVLVLIFL